ncbi:hypothetical protein ACVIRM_007008 [Rhizobium laguerreae]
MTKVLKLLFAGVSAPDLPGTAADERAADAGWPLM